MFRRKGKAVLVVLLATVFFAGGALRFTPVANAATNYALIWSQQIIAMQSKWASPGVPDKWGGGYEYIAKSSGTTTYEVSNGAQLRYALTYLDTGDTVKLVKDIDLNCRYGFQWEPIDFKGKSIILDGNGKTIYNLRVETKNPDSGNSCFIMNIGDNSTVKDLTFKNVVLHAYQDQWVSATYPVTGTGTFPRAAALFADIYRKNILFENVGLENALVSADKFWAHAFLMVMRQEAYTNDDFGDVKINNCYSKNVVTYAPGDGRIACSSAFVGGGLGRREGNTTGGLEVTNCYAVDSMVIASSGHSGGFSSCNSGHVTIKNCFSDVVVYGTTATGAFQGVIHQGDFLFENCFALGSVEGEAYIGGFAATYSREVGKINISKPERKYYHRDATLNFRNCYSGAVVGMINGGRYMGSFFGAMTYPDERIKEEDVNNYDRTANKYIFNNCYAMGETGNIDLIVDSDYSPGTVGGFIGDDGVMTDYTYGKGTPNPLYEYNNCYYDKQTTAMREWAIGRSKKLNGTKTAILTEVKGVLTTSTGKAGRGLASMTGDSKGFQDFPELDPLHPAWDYQEGRYPELTVFQSANGFSNSLLVKAYSKASVAAVQLEPWADLEDKNYLNTKTNKTYDQTFVYDTVRDLTVGFELTSGVDWRQIADPHRAPDPINNPDKPVVKLYNEGTDWVPSYITLPVLTLVTDNGKTYARNPAPGIQWLSANDTEHGVDKDNNPISETGQRRLRVIPTANLYTGKSTIVKTGNTVDPYKEVYDHADDVYMAYSTGQRMSYYLDNITRGVFPDDNLTTKQYNVNKGITGWTTSEENKFKDVATDHLQTGSTITVDGMRLAYSQMVGDQWQEIDHVKNGDLERNGFGADDNLGLDNDLNKRYNKLFSGRAAFTKDSEGKYTLLDELGLYALRYKWKLADGRYLEGGKIISVIKGLNDAVIEVQDGQEHPVSDEVTPGISFNQTDPDLTGPTLARTEEPNIPYGTNTRLGWRHNTSFEDIKQVDVKIGRDSFENVGINQPMNVVRTYYKDFFMERDRMNITAVTITKTYRLEKEGTGPQYATYLRFTQSPTESVVPEFQFTDLEEDVHVLLVVGPVVVEPEYIYINLKQLVLDHAPKVSLPAFGYAKLNEIPSDTAVADFAQSRNVVCKSYGIMDPELNTIYYQTNFIRYRLPASEFYRVTPIIPQYYSLVLINYSQSGPIGSEHNTKGPSVTLDYTDEPEYWVTFQLRANPSPNPNNTTEATPNAFPAFTPGPTATPKP